MSVLHVIAHPLHYVGSIIIYIYILHNIHYTLISCVVRAVPVYNIHAVMYILLCVYIILYTFGREC